MAWSIPTYVGTYMGGNPSAARTAMFELCRAVNQREGLLSLTKTQFYKADGTQAADLTSGDLAGIRVTGADSPAFVNLTRVRDAVLKFCNSPAQTTANLAAFTTSLGVDTTYTKASMESAIGTDLDADPIRPQEARFWQAMQDALDRLVYVQRVWFANSNSAETGGQSGTIVFGTAQDAWDARDTDPISGVFVGDNGASVGWRITETAGGANHAAYYRSQAVMPVTTNMSLVTIPASSAKIYMQQVRSSSTTSANFSYELTNTDVSITGTTSFSGADTETITIDTHTGDPFATDEELTLTITTTIPSTQPFSPATQGYTYVRPSLADGEFILYHDLSGSLTDQA